MWAVLGLLMLAALVAAPQTTGAGLGLRRFLTPGVSGEVTVAQRFVMNQDHLTGVEIRPEVAGPLSGSFRLSIRDVRAPDVERAADVPAEVLAREDAYMFWFTPIDVARTRSFELTIRPTAVDPGRGIAFWATPGARLDGGGLFINGVPRWASLAFHTRTTAVRPLRAMFFPSGSGRPPLWLCVAGLAGAWIALRFVLNAVVASGDDIGLGE
jgi:hypothetical protein